MANINLTHANLDAVLNNGLVNPEILQQVIDVSKLPLPFTNRSGGGSTGNRLFEWTQDRLQAVDPANRVVDGQDASGNDAATGARVSNRIQISDKVVKVSLLGEAANSIGGVGKIAYQVRQRGRELARDKEAMLLANVGAVAGDGDSVASQTAGLEAWCDGKILVPGTYPDGGAAVPASYVQTGALQWVGSGTQPTGGGWENNANGGPAAWTYTSNVAGALTETAIDAIAIALFRNTGLMIEREFLCRPEVLSIISKYYFGAGARVATLQSDVSQGSSSPARANTSVNEIITDYGMIKLQADAVQQIADAASSSDTAFILDYSSIEITQMTGLRVEPLAKLGLSEQRQLSESYGLKMLAGAENQGIIQGIDATTPMVP